MNFFFGKPIDFAIMAHDCGIYGVYLMFCEELHICNYTYKLHIKNIIMKNFHCYFRISNKMMDNLLLYINHNTRNKVAVIIHLTIQHKPPEQTYLKITFLPTKEPLSCRIATRNGGHQVWNSFTHWCITVAGQTKITGPKPL